MFHALEVSLEILIDKRAAHVYDDFSFKNVAAITLFSRAPPDINI